MALGGPAIMVTGSHIPADRNGLKFYTPLGEITKDDEAGINAALGNVEIGGTVEVQDGNALAGDRYRQRYRHFLQPAMLTGRRIGVFEHSSVARDLLCSLLTRAGATVVRLGRAAEFVAVDTEAFSDAIFEPRHRWIAEHRLDAIASTDGDGDRPLLIDGTGDFVRGDALGLLAAQFVGADVVVTPVTSNSAIETVGTFSSVVRTRVGSPYVIAGMEKAADEGGKVVGFEANGGVLLGSDATVNGHTLSKLPTRDAVLPILSALGMAAKEGMSLAELVGLLPLRAALSDRLTEVPAEKTTALVAQLLDESEFAAAYFAEAGEIAAVSTIDGPRFTLTSGDVVHYRPSGNAPELRCYVEGATPARAAELLRWGLEAAARVVR
jgi:phosphomannomutase